MATSTFTRAYRAQRAAKRNRRPRTPLLVLAARAAARVLPTWHGFRRLTLHVAGLGGLSYAAWMISEPAGVAIGSLSLLVLEALIGSDR